MMVCDVVFIVPHGLLVCLHLRWHMTDASSECRQSCCPIRWLGQAVSLCSFPVHSTLSSRIGPVPGPKYAPAAAIAPV